jgi:hypothetical protein
LARICSSFFFEFEKSLIFILKSWENQTHYEITYDKNSGFNIKDSFDNYNINEDSSIKIFINYGKYDYGRHLDDIQLDVLQIELDPASLQIKTQYESPFI